MFKALYLSLFKYIIASRKKSSVPLCTGQRFLSTVHPATNIIDSILGKLRIRNENVRMDGHADPCRINDKVQLDLYRKIIFGRNINKCTEIKKTIETIVEFLGIFLIIGNYHPITCPM